MKKKIDVEKKIYSTFAEVASSIGYSPLHGNIIGVLLVKNKPVSLQELAKETGYSTSMISLSLDFLEVLGMIKRVKKSADRKLYIKLNGDLLESLKRIIAMKIKKSISDSLFEFDGYKKSLLKSGDKNSLKAIEILEKNIKRLEIYIDILSRVKLPISGMSEQEQ